MVAEEIGLFVPGRQGSAERAPFGREKQLNATKTDLRRSRTSKQFGVRLHGLRRRIDAYFIGLGL